MTARASPPALLSDDRFTCTVQVLPATNSLPVTGELDFATAPLLLDAAELIRTAPARDLTVHLHAVRFLGAGGINALVHLSNAQRSAGRTLLLTGTPARLIRIFRLALADWLLPPGELNPRPHQPDAPIES